MLRKPRNVLELYTACQVHKRHSFSGSTIFWSLVASTYDLLVLTCHFIKRLCLMLLHFQLLLFLLSCWPFVVVLGFCVESYQNLLNKRKSELYHKAFIQIFLWLIQGHFLRKTQGNYFMFNQFIQGHIHRNEVKQTKIDPLARLA